MVCDHVILPFVITYLYTCNVVNTPVFLICVLLCVYIRRPPGWPLHPTIIGRVCDGPTHFATGEFLLCLSLHQTAAYALFLWGIWEGTTVIVSVACSMYYIMARFFVGWCDYNAYAHFLYPYPYFLWSLVTIHATNGN